MKKNLKVVFFYLISLVYLSFPACAESYRIATGPNNSSYKNFSIQLSKEIVKSDSSKKIHLIETTGSVENISLLRSGVADFAVLQQNIAAEAYFSEVTPYKGFEVLGPIYPEILQIIIFGKNHQSNKSFSISEISNLLKSQQVEKFYIDGDATASRLTIQKLLALHGIGESTIPYTQLSDHNKPKECQTICLAAVVDKFFNIFDLYNIDKASFVHLTIQEYLDLEGKIGGFDLFQITQDKNSRFLAIGTWAIVVAGHTLDTSTNAELKDGIESYISISQRDSLKNKSFDVSVVEIRPNKSIKKIPSADYIKKAVFSSLPLARGLEKKLQNGLTPKSVIIYALLFFFGYYVCKKLFTLERKQVWHRYKHFIFSAGFLVFIFMLFGKLIHTSEISLAAETGVVSTLSTYSLIDMYEWITIFAFTGYNGTAFPVSMFGQLISTFSHFIGIGTALFSVLAEIIFMRKQKKREAGGYSMKLSKHIVICGGNDQLQQLISNLENSYKEYNESLPKIVIIYPKFQELLAKSTYLKKLHEIGGIEYIKGAVRDESTLEAACVSSAKMIYLLAEGKTISSDEKTLLRALSISRFCRKKQKALSNTDIDSAYMVAEISNVSFHDPLLNADVNEIVNTSFLSENLLIQSALNPGVSKIINSLLTIDDGHEFYSIKVALYQKLIGKNFDTLLTDLRKDTTLLIGIQVGVFGESGEEVIDTNLVATELQSLNIKRQMLTNPHTPAEIAYTVRQHDTLVVLSESKKLLDATLKAYK